MTRCSQSLCCRWIRCACSHLFSVVTWPFLMLLFHVFVKYKNSISQPSWLFRRWGWGNVIVLQWSCTDRVVGSSSSVESVWCWLCNGWIAASWSTQNCLCWWCSKTTASRYCQQLLQLAVIYVHLLVKMFKISSEVYNTEQNKMVV